MSTERALLRGAVIPTLIVALISISLSTWIMGSAGLVGSLLAQFVVIIFFATNIGTARLTRDLDPVMTMSIAMFSYMAKVLLLGAFLFLVTTFISEAACDRKAFALSALAATFAWLGGEIKAYLGLKLHLQLPPRQ